MRLGAGRWRRFAKALARATALAIIGAARPAAGTAPPSAPPPAGVVTVDRDPWGVPHILASREEDGFYGLGYATTQDQPARLYLDVLRARGELAARLAPDDLPPVLRDALPTVEAMIESDYRIRLWGLRAAAAAAAPRLDAQLARDYASYLAGVERFARDNPAAVPSWRPADLSVADLVAVLHEGFWDGYEAGVAVDDCERGGAPMASLTGRKQAGYSNAWALAPRRTASGEAVLLSDPHGGIDGRFTHEFTFQAGELHTTGFSLGPVMIIGHNETVGWGLTTGAPDVADCYAIKTQPDDPLTYLFDGHPRRIEQTSIEIAVKGRAPIEATARHATVNGIRSPVIAEKGGTLFVAVTPYLGDLEGMHNAIYRMNKARDTDEFLAAVATGGMFPQNILAADTRGETIYIHAGLVPVRPDPSIDWTRPVPGNSSRFAWKGIHPVGDLVVIRSPADGYLENNNTDPRFMDRPAPPETVGKPEYSLADGSIPSAGPSVRATMFLDRMAERQTFSEGDVFALALDISSYKSAEWLGILRASLATTPLAEDDRRFADDLLTFNGELDARSTAALKYILWREALRDGMVDADGVALADVVLRGEPPGPELLARASGAVKIATRRLSGMPDGLTRTFGQTFRLQAGNATVPMSGGSLRDDWPGGTKPPECKADDRLCPDSLRVVRYAPPASGERVAVQGTRIMRLDFLSSHGIRSFSYQNPGVSDDPTSPHSSDQASALVSRRMLKPVLFRTEELQDHIASSLTLDTSDRAARATGSVTRAQP